MEEQKQAEQQKAGQKKAEHGKHSLNMTYEILFDILRTERRREDVQELSSSFYDDVVEYLKQKKETINKREHESGIDSFDEIKALKIQYDNAKKLVKEIYERREKKVLLMAINRSRARILIQPKYLLPQEIEFYEQLTLLLDTYRSSILEKLVNGLHPKQQISLINNLNNLQSKHEIEKEMEKTIPKAEVQCTSETVSDTVASVVTEDMAHPKNIKIKFLHETDKFLGSELEIYGPFAANTVAEIPAKLASIFINNGVAEEIKNPNHPKGGGI